jgi:hypothetical protein
MKPFNSFLIITTLLTITILFFPVKAGAQQLNPKYYDMGSPILMDIWVDPVNGNDANSGIDRSHALLTLSAAWGILPGNTSTTGYRIKLAAGDYVYRDAGTNNIVGLYLDERHGTFNCPIIIESADGPLAAHLISSLDFRDVSYIYLIGLDFRTDVSSEGGGNTVHFADGEYILINKCKIDGFDGITRKSQETLKVNQVKYIYVEDCDISGAFWFSLDYVGVQYGHIQGCRIHDASVDCLLLKGGTAQIRVEDNIIYNAERFGFSAGQGAGFDFMVVPWLHYEAYDLKFFNNVVYNTYYAGIAVLGGYNINISYNTFYRVGIDNTGDRTLMTFNLGQRGCDGAENDTCNTHHLLGGWSPGPWNNPAVPYGTESDCIPNKNVFVYNNIFYNPGADSTVGPQIEIRAPYDGTDQSATFLTAGNIPNPALSDDNVQIKGNIIWNGSVNKWLGIDENTGGQDSNPTCNRAQLMSDNTINTIEPQFVNASAYNFHPASGGNIFTSATFALPAFTGTDRPAMPLVPLGNLINSIIRDYDGNVRSASGPPGAFVSSTVSINVDNKSAIPNDFRLEQNYPNPFNPTTRIRYELPKSTYVEINIFDILGREIASLVKKELPAGIHSVQFNANNLPSGTYIYRIQAGEYSQSRKMILLK